MAEVPSHAGGSRPFRIEGAPVRGRLVRLDAAVDEILAKHDYPPPVSDLLAQALVLCVLLAGGLKYEGIFTLEARGKGPVRFIVVDLTSAGRLRGFAQFDADALKGLAAAPRGGSLPRLIGAGVLAFTVDQGPDSERYQGLVELEGETLADCAHAYFQRSEQIPTGIKLAARRAGDGWHAGGLMVQWLPGEGGRGGRVLDETDAEDWRRILALMASVRSDELLAPEISDEALLYRLFHEDGVWVYPRRAVLFGCRCSRERAHALLSHLPAPELSRLAVDGRFEVACQFCNGTEIFEAAEFGVSV